MRSANMVCSKGTIFLMATLVPVGLWMAEQLEVYGRLVGFANKLSSGSRCLDVGSHAHGHHSHDAVGTFANHILHLILAADVAGVEFVSSPLSWTSYTRARSQRTIGLS